MAKKRLSPAAVLDSLVNPNEGGLVNTAWAHEHNIDAGASKAAAKIAGNFEAGDDGEIYNELMQEIVEPAFLAGFDFALALQQAVRRFEDGDASALQPFLSAARPQRKLAAA